MLSAKSCFICDLEVRPYVTSDAESVLVCIIREGVVPAGGQADSIVSVTLGHPLGWMMEARFQPEAVAHT